MALVIGTDEAGYGPNLGPLVITATAWQVPDEDLDGNLYARLAHVLAHPQQSADERQERLLVGDSKQIYKAGAGLDLLELGVLAMAGLLQLHPRTWADAWNLLAPDCDGELSSAPWYCDFSGSLPLACSPDDLSLATRRCLAGLDAAGVALRAIRCRAIFPTEWNGLLVGGQGKAEILSVSTLKLVACLLEQWPHERVLVHCDKHGGRSRYAALLQSAFPDEWVEVRQEGRALSSYRIRSAGRQWDFRFVTQGESHPACALASMTSKYLRELAMRAFNAFWCERIPGLRPTAGYPVDASRFRGEIAAEQRRLGIGDAVLWRVR